MSLSHSRAFSAPRLQICVLQQYRDAANRCSAATLGSATAGGLGWLGPGRNKPGTSPRRQAGHRAQLPAPGYREENL